jgi:hypothetical protein
VEREGKENSFLKKLKFPFQTELYVQRKGKLRRRDLLEKKTTYFAHIRRPAIICSLAENLKYEITSATQSSSGPVSGCDLIQTND